MAYLLQFCGVSDPLQLFHLEQSSLLVLLALASLAGASGQPAPAWPTLLLIAAAATALEQLSGYGIDNLSVPLATALLWQQLSLSTPSLLLTP